MSDFSMEALLPLVAELAERYTSKESTSVSYDVARQLMGAVLYFMREAECDGRGAESDDRGADCDGREAECDGRGAECDGREAECDDRGAGGTGSLTDVDGAGGAKHLYDEGRILVMEKVMAAKKMYEGFIGDFRSYGSRCYYETVVKGMPAFFAAYDVRYNPQNHILNFDYPILGGLENRCGIDAVYYYLDCVRLEQSFLSRFPGEYVKSVLTHIYYSYGELFINLSSALMRNTVGHLMLLKPIMDEGFTPGEYEKLRTRIMDEYGIGVYDMEGRDMEGRDMEGRDMEGRDMEGRDAEGRDAEGRDAEGHTSREHLSGFLTGAIEHMVVTLCGGDKKLAKYLLKDVGDFGAELLNAAEHGCLETIFGC